MDTKCDDRFEDCRSSVTGDLDMIEDWSRKQDKMRERIVEVDTEHWQKRKLVVSADVDCQLLQSGDKILRFVAGFDLSFLKSDSSVACVAIVVCRMPNLEVVHKECSMVDLICPYIPGFLAFREAQFVIDAFRKLETENPEFIPQAILLDGNGILHKRGCGLACHVGVSLDVPTVGVAKNLYHVDGIEKGEAHRDQVKSLINKGDSFALIHQNGTTLGSALKTCKAATKPVYISVGHKISLETSTWLVNLCSKYRIPEPIRQADILSREFLRDKFPE